MVTVSANNPAA